MMQSNHSNDHELLTRFRVENTEYGNLDWEKVTAHRLTSLNKGDDPVGTLLTAASQAFPPGAGSNIKFKYEGKPITAFQINGMFVTYQAFSSDSYKCVELTTDDHNIKAMKLTISQIGMFNQNKATISATKDIQKAANVINEMVQSPLYIKQQETNKRIQTSNTAPNVLEKKKSTSEFMIAFQYFIQRNNSFVTSPLYGATP